MCPEDGSLLSMVSQACCVPRDIQAKILPFFRVGGIISEMSFKFFLQLVLYASLYCLHVLVFMAVFVAEVRSEVSGFLIDLSHNEIFSVPALWRKAISYVRLDRMSAVASTCENTSSALVQS